MRRNAKTCLLLRLPPEIRNIIYSLAIGGNRLWVGYEPHAQYWDKRKPRSQIDDRCRIHYGGGLYCRHCEVFGRCDAPQRSRNRVLSDSKGLHLGLLRVCRQIYAEVGILHYIRNDFHFENDWMLKRFWKTLKPIHKRCLEERRKPGNISQDRFGNQSRTSCFI